MNENMRTYHSIQQKRQRQLLPLRRTPPFFISYRYLRQKWMLSPTHLRTRGWIFLMGDSWHFWQPESARSVTNHPCPRWARRLLGGLLGGLPLASKTVSLTVSKMAASQLAPGVENGDFLFRGWCLLAARVCLACMHKRRVYGATRNCFNIS